ncbi:pullulanase [Paenibacillus glacialis]|uniref:pullulanase n=1 Tax=Paenibacillus glacialis TaxID=494026 RepID=A0A168F8U4_9BACL|nr:pullulanase [Paenibacillus glacialis]OAB35970.1 pullulanase [Paenibacillus glacialis]
MKSTFRRKQMLSIFMILILIISSIGFYPSQVGASAPTKVVLVGSLQSELGASGDWDPANSATEMIDMGDGNYQFTGDLPAGTYDYKIAIGGAGGISYGFDNYTNQAGVNHKGDIRITLLQDTQVAFYYNDATHKIADSTYYTPLAMDKLPRVVGNLQTEIGDGTDWSQQSASAMMTDDDFDNVYSVTKVVYGDDYEYKIVLGSTWDDPAYPTSGNKLLSLSQELPVTFNYNAIDHNVTADFVVPVEPEEPSSEVPSGHLRIHYNQDADEAAGLGLWLFKDVVMPSKVWSTDATPFTAEKVDSYGVYIDVPLITNAKEVGFIVVNRTTGNKDGGDKVAKLDSAKVNEVWIQRGSDAISMFEPVDLPANTVRIHYVRQDHNHSAFGLWLFNDVAVKSETVGSWPAGATSFTADKTDRYGAYIDVPLIEGAKKIGMIALNKTSGNKDGGDKTFNLLDRYKQIWIKQGDDTVYVSPYGEVATGLLSAEVLSESKVLLGFTMTEGLEASAVKSGLSITDKNGDIVTVKNVQITSSRTVEVNTSPFELENTPLSITYSGRNVTAITGWKMLDEMYNYEGDDLGATYKAGSVTFKLWAPKASSVIANVYNKDDSTQLMGSANLVKGDKGVWTAGVAPGDLIGANVTDLKGYYYQYEVTNNGETKQVLDPYAKSMAEFRVNTKGEVGPDRDAVGKAAIVDLSGTDPAGFDYADIKGYENREDAIIWEIHVRDFTSDPTIENDLNNATWGSFDAFKSKLDYLQSLGVTHIQLLPVMAWYYGDESLMKERELDYSARDNEYNWGYDPHNYFSPDGAYSEDPTDPELRIKELKAMIDAIHDAGMGVVLDVVYTHMAQASLLNDIVPNYYAFQDANGNNIGGFGNNLATNHKMAEKLMVDSVKYWFDEYKIDGMRWDMMGDATYDAVQNAYDAAEAINPKALFIGEGWRTFGGAAADPSLAGKGADQDWMDKTDSVGVFSDEIRNELKSGFGNEGEPRFITGGARDINVILNNIKAQPSNTADDDPGDMVQYIEAHDNLPLYDIIAQSIKKDPSIAANDLEIHKRIRIGNLLILTSQGTAFLHAGQEYGRTKQWKAAGKPEQKYHELADEAGGVFGYFVHDSYDSSDAINKFDWEKATNEMQYPVNNTTREYTTGLIALRKSTDAFRLGDKSLVDSNITLISAPEVQSRDLIMGYKNKATDGTGHYYVFVNADSKERTMTLDEDLTTGKVLVDNDEAGLNEVSTKSGFVLKADSITLNPLTAVIIQQDTAAAVVRSLEPDTTKYALEVGKSHQTAINAKYDDGSQRTVTNQATYGSSDMQVATVTAKGLVKAVAKGTATIKVTYGGKTTNITVTVTTEPVNDKRYVQFNYIRPDKDYKDWNLWVWNTGVKNDQINFEKVENGVASVMIEIGPQAMGVGFVLRKGTDWNTAKQDFPDDRTIPVTPGAMFTKVNVTSMVQELDILPSIRGPVLNDGNITFMYRDDALYESGQMTKITNAKVKVNGTEYAMTYDRTKEWFSYTLSNVKNGTYEYTFLITNDGKTIEVTDPHNTVNGKSVVEYYIPVVKIQSTINPTVISSKENAVLKLKVSSNDQSTTYKEAYMDLTALGGPSKVKIDTDLMEQTFGVKDSIATGLKNIPITLVDQFGNKHTHRATIEIKARTYTGKLDFDWDEARIYFALTDRYKDGDPTNNQDVDKTHLEAYHGGDFRGLIDKLDYMQQLGINTLWITPIVDNIDFNKGLDFNSKQYGYHGYWAKDFTKIDEHLGDLATFKELIDTAHDKGIKIMVDVVLNHTGYGLKENDARPGITQADKDRFANMLRTDGMSSEEDPIKGELAQLPDLKTEDRDVRKQLIDWQAGWLDRARTDRGDTIDYFRVDTVKHVDDTTWKAFKNALTTIDPDFKMIGEYFGASVGSDGGTLQSGQMDSLLDFSFKENARDFADGKIESVEAYLANREAQMDNTRTMGQFLSSHDENGFLNDYVKGDKGKLKIAAALQITSKGQPVIYYGEELGRSGNNAGDMSKGEFSENRSDMPWNQLDTEKALHDHYQKLLTIRAKYSKLFSKGTRTSLAASNEGGYLAFSKNVDSQNVVTVINTRTATKDVTICVPFEKGIQVKDEYSGKIYNVTNDQKVSFSLPGMNEGGTVILVAVPGDTGTGVGPGTDNSNSSSNYSNSNSATQTQKIVSEELLRKGKEKISIDLAAKENGVLLPLKAAELVGANPIEINKGDFSVQLPSSLLKVTQELIPASQSEGAVISFKMDEVTQASAKSLIGKSDNSTTQLKLASKMFDFDLSLKMKDGKEVKTESFSSAITVAFTVDPSADKKLLGVYSVSDDGKVEYVGGYWENGKLKANVNHSGKYVVIEYNKLFADVQGHWAQVAIMELAAKHVVEGATDSTFNPDQKLTRAEFAAMLVRTLSLKDAGSVSFTDVDSSSWYASAVSTAYHNGLVKGKNESTFAPQATITREEMAMMILRAYQLNNEASAVPNSSASAFIDEQQISSWAVEEVRAVTSLGLMNGHSKKEFVPKSNTSRAESAQAIVNLLHKIQ